MTFVATTLLYPGALALLSIGAGLLVDEIAGRFMAPALLVSVGVAALIAVSQLITFVPALAPATPYVLVAVALAGAVLARRRIPALAARIAARPLLAAGPVVAYALALAPVLAGGRASFSSFMALADSAVHIIGADYLIHHGQSYAHLDLANSYGQFIHGYYAGSYPSGADTLFGGSAQLLGLSLMWSFQPFNAFLLATAFGPAWSLARRMSLSPPLAWTAALSVVLPALVYGYELIGSVKEIAALAMILTAGALVAAYRSWLAGPARRGVPIALVLAAGVSALGAAFGVWALVTIAVLVFVLAASVVRGATTPRAALALVAVVAGTAVIAVLPTLVHLSGSVQVASNIASTSNPGNLHAPLRAIQALGVWLSDSYKLHPHGTNSTLTHALALLVLALAVLGAVRLLRTRAFALASWIGLSLLAWLVVSQSVNTWASAKTLMLSSPVVLLLAWAGVAAVSARARHPAAARREEAQSPALGPSRTARGPARRRVAALALAAGLAAVLLGGELVSDAMQYRSSNLAPTTRYEQLASLDARFRGQGPALFTDFDEYALYELRDLDVGGPDFVFAPPALAGLAAGYGTAVDLERASPQALARYPLIITRRDPLLARPPVGYEEVAQNHYYDVLRRTPDAPAAIAHVRLIGDAAAQCTEIGALAARELRSRSTAVTLAAAPRPRIVPVALASASRPARWGHERGGLVMSVPGTLRASFRLPRSGLWRLWLQGQFMPPIAVAIDGRPLATLSGELSGNSLVPDIVQLHQVQLDAGPHTLSVRRSSPGLRPGGRGAAVLDAAFLTLGSEAIAPAPVRVPLARWRSLCGRHPRPSLGAPELQRYAWVELLPAGA
jgi:hypothetical protein